MRLAKTVITVLAVVALLGGLVAVAWAQGQPPAKPSQPAKPAAKASAPAKPAQAPKKAVAPAKAAPATKPAAKAAERQKAKAAAPTPKLRPAAVVSRPAGRRDPFNPLVSRQLPGGGIPANLPPGKAGLIISTLRVDGIVRGPNGMIAIVSNPQQRVYFLHEGDQLYDGRVERITMEAVSFHEVGKDAFGKPVDRQVVKRLYPSPGE